MITNVIVVICIVSIPTFLSGGAAGQPHPSKIVVMNSGGTGGGSDSPTPLNNHFNTFQQVMDSLSEDESDNGEKDVDKIQVGSPLQTLLFNERDPIQTVYTKQDSGDIPKEPDFYTEYAKDSSMLHETSSAVIKRLCNVKTKKKTPCAQNLCQCVGDLADCSGKPSAPNIGYAPKLPENIKCIFLANNEIKSLIESFFANVSNFLVVDLSGNYLKTISNRTFERLTNLQYLILNNMKGFIDYKMLRSVLNKPPKLRLDLMGNGLKEVPSDYFSNYRNKTMAQIYMDFNHFPDLNLREFSQLEKLSFLSFANCSVNSVTSALMPRLTGLNLKNNVITAFPKTCDEKPTVSDVGDNLKKSANMTKITLFPSLSQLLDLSSNLITTLPAWDEFCLPKLLTLNLDLNNFTKIPEKTFTSLTSLRLLSLIRSLSPITSIGAAAFGIPNMTTLLLNKDGIDFGSPNVSTAMFEGAFKFSLLSLKDNHFGNISEASIEELFWHMRGLRNLYISFCGLKQIPVQALSQLSHLQKIMLSGNDIVEIPPKAFESLKELERLSLDANHISCVRENSFSNDTISRLKEIDLSKNDFLCNCDLLWFQSWMREAPPKYFANWKLYRCSDRPSVAVQDFEQSLQACLLGQTAKMLLAVVTAVLIVLFVGFAIGFRYRWDIRLWIYEKRMLSRGLGFMIPEGADPYDLFIVHCNDDAEWVEKDLVSVIENRWKLKACLHSRDFLAGGHIIQNIIDSMNRSKLIMVVVSANFARSRWCNFELQLCQSHVIENDLRILPVKLDEIETRDMSAALLALYKTSCFLEWPAMDSNDRDEVYWGHVRTFWSRLRKSLSELIKDKKEQTSVMVVDDAGRR
ncbi:unnamed protein product [Lymnaea stagnalis]|uniref:TIR domain-containing protein n=1 Tax=Lymnaea stagnalis TaxID=6523 RepID=A0AAV2ICL6_LYMST